METTENRIIMRILFTANGGTWDSDIDPRFGRAEYLVLYDDTSDGLDVIDNRSVKDEAHGAGTATAQKVFELKPDILITGNGPGENAAFALKRLNMEIYVNAHNMKLREAYDSFREGKLEKL